jgi:sulfate/thiosulfate transport system substrate-binding protein
MTQRIRLAAVAAAALAVPALLAGCAASNGSSSSSSNSVSVVGFSVLKTANEPVISAFQKTSSGKGTSFTTSYGASGDQSRAVQGGLHADEVHLSLEPDVQALVPKFVDSNWANTPTHGMLTDSEVVFLVRKGNPLHIHSWNDLVKPGVKLVTPNPESSGGAKWNLLAAWAHVSGAGGSDAQAKTFVTKLLGNAVALPGSASDALASFLAGNGDVLLAYESDAIAAKAAGDPVDYIVPKDTLLIQNPVALTKDASTAAKNFLKFQLSKQGQTLYAQAGFRPVIAGVHTTVKGANNPNNPFPAVPQQYTIDKTFGGWDNANTKFFDTNNGIITKIISSVHVGS